MVTTMPLPTSYLAYSDCFAALDKALEDSRGGRIPLPDEDAAMHLRMRMNYARKLDREKNAELYDPDHPLHGRSEYDKLYARINSHNGKVYLYLLRREAIPVELLTEVEAEAEIEADPPTPPPADKPAPKLTLRPISSQVLAFKRRI